MAVRARPALPPSSASSSAWDAWLPSLLAGLVTLGLLAAALSARGAQFLDSYPFLTADSYDWITEGLYLYLRIVDPAQALGELYGVRPPVFVLVTALDHALAANGAAILFVSIGSLFLQCWFFDRSLQLFGVALAYRLLFVAMLLLVPYNGLRYHVLADGLAIALMQGSIHFLLRYQLVPQRSRWLVLGSAFALAAGLTQLYGLIPLLVFAGLRAAVGLMRENRIVWRPVLAAVLTLAAFAGIAAAWQRVMPHDTTRFSLDRLVPSMAMGRFYAEVWPWAFLFALPVGIALLRALRVPGWARRAPLPFLAACAAAFALLTFCYQWPEDRFTFYWFAIALMCLALALHFAVQQAGARPVGASTAVWLSCAVLAAQSLLVAPRNPFAQTFHHAQLAPGETWVGKLLTAEPISRLELAETCGDPRRLCPAVAGTPLLRDSVRYIHRVLSHYLLLSLLDQERRSSPGPRNGSPRR